MSDNIEQVLKNIGDGNKKPCIKVGVCYGLTVNNIKYHCEIRNYGILTIWKNDKIIYKNGYNQPETWDYLTDLITAIEDYGDVENK